MSRRTSIGVVIDRQRAIEMGGARWGMDVVAR
jgi:hypothetical protein